MHRNILKAFSTAVIAVLPGCMSMSGISTTAQPKDTAQLEAGHDISEARHDLPWPGEAWWQVFQDPQLDALVNHSLQQHPDIRAARSRTAIAEAQAQAAGALLAPQASANGTLMRERFTSLQFIPPPWAGHTEWNNKATLNLGYDLDLWGQRAQQWQSALDRTQATAAEAQQVKLSLTTALVMQYIALSRAHALHDITHHRLDIAHQQLDIRKRALAAGLGTEIEVTEAESLIPALRAQLEAGDERITLLRQQLAALAGEGPGYAERLHPPKLSLDADIGLPDALPANLVGRRPDIVAAKWRIEAARHNIASAKAAFYPNINLLGFVGLQAMGFGKILTESGMVAGVGPALSLPLFDGGLRRGNLAATTADYDLAVEQYNSILLQSLQEISAQLVTLRSNAIQHAELLDALRLAQRSKKLALTHHQAGLANYLQVLDAEHHVLTQHAALVDLEASRLSAYADLMKALGGGAGQPPSGLHQ
ncbi:efflux transporter outer membrane subunit [Methylobacillus sp.]|uniref:efflux transporter outer membrane subunit n=1 Tax=Methylobacillus sp. TaxID=56818 RepID=UPI0012C68930|nr:efflux transporter outer membrane subunit [Methylobacillus sp.]MPS47559.1 efflux transporter outer membrane subunit [Methylobacillus sp.]